MVLISRLVSVISYRDNGKFPGLVQESAADEGPDIKPGWSLRAEREDAGLGLKMVGEYARGFFGNEAMMQELQIMG